MIILSWPVILWNERSLLSNTTDAGLSTDYLYGTDGQRAVKRSGRSEVLYFNKFFSENFRPEFTTDALMTKNIFLGTERIVTKQCSKDAREDFAEAGTQSEADQQYYYHADHLGSVSAITDSDGDVYERLEYTPYGEVWIDLQYGTTAFDFDSPFKFTGKELDEARTIAGVLCAGLYYYGARYLDPRYSVWKSADPALGEYIPRAPIDDDSKKYNQNLPGMGGVFNAINLHLYHYAGNNPIKYVDPDGRWTDNGDGTYTAQAGDTLLKRAKDTTGNSANWKIYGYSESQARLIKPGDVVNTRVYNTPDDAATAFGNGELGPSKTSDVEVGSSIYKLTTPDGSTKYSYTNPSTGTQHGCNPSMYSDASKIESYIHTHGAESGPSYDDESFSPQDKKYAKSLSINGYVVTPSGNIKQYDSSTETTRTVIDIDPATDPMP